MISTTFLLLEWFAVIAEVGSRNSRSSVRFAEATPSISFSRAFKVMHESYCLARWFNARGDWIGEASIRRHDQILEVIYAGLVVGQSITIGIDIEPTRQGIVGTRDLVSCPKCCGTVDILYLVNKEFKCFECNRLRYSSQGLTSRERWAQRRLSLEQDAQRPRDFGEHKSTYLRRRAAAVRKLAELGPAEEIQVRRRPMPKAVITRYSPNHLGPWETHP